MFIRKKRRRNLKGKKLLRERKRLERMWHIKEDDWVELVNLLTQLDKDLKVRREENIEF